MNYNYLKNKNLKTFDIFTITWVLPYNLNRSILMVV